MFKKKEWKDSVACCLFYCQKRSKSFFMNETKNDKKYRALYVIYVNSMKNIEKQRRRKYD